MMVVFEKRPVGDSLKQTADIWFRGHLTCLCKSGLITMLAQLNLYNLLLGHPCALGAPSPPPTVVSDCYYLYFLTEIFHAQFMKIGSYIIIKSTKDTSNKLHVFN